MCIFVFGVFLQMQDHYRTQGKLILSALDREFTGATHLMNYNRPTGGMFLWATFDNNPKMRGVKSHELFVQLAAKGVIAVPGEEFYVPPLDDNTSGKREFPTLRLSFAAPSEQAINEGVARLAAALK